MKISRQFAGTDKFFSGRNPATSVTVHETGNYDVGADAQATADYQKNGAGGRSASWQWQVDDHQAVQSFGNHVRCWHAGDGDAPEGGNMTSVAVEVCVNADGDYRMALANAAELIRDHILPDIAADDDDLFQHNAWSGKDCPRWLRAGKDLDWREFLRLVTGKDVVAMAGMTSPVKGRVSSEYGWREWSNSFHAGIDIAAPVGTPVYAAFAGTVKDEGADVAPWRSGTRNVLIENPDGEGQYYGHLHRNFVSVGEHVAQGEKIGEVGARGNVTGPHLHFEVWSNADSPSTHRNPRVDFKYFGIAPGSTPQGTSTGRPPGGGASGGTTGGKHKGDGSVGPSGQGAEDTAAIQRALAAMGYDVGPDDGVYGPRTEAAVKAYQADQNRWGHAGLVEDGDWGPVTQAWFEWVEELQRALPAWEGVPNLVVDGNYGPKTHDAVETVQRRNGLFVDGFAGPKTTAFMRKYGSNISDRP